jgi:MOSC domain-containing protein YiiM
MPPVVVALHLTRRSRAPVEPVARADALLEQGLAGNRHTRPNNRGRQVLFIDAETLEGLDLVPGQVREQVTVRGLDLAAMVTGTRFGVGTAVFEIGAPCAPCQRMDEIRPGLREVLEGCRGRFARVVQAGSLAVGDPVQVLDSERV